MARSMYAGIVDVLGAEIAGGTLSAGSVVSLASLEERFEVSRTVAREAMRSLESKGMIEARRRVGLIVADGLERFDEETYRTFEAAAASAGLQFVVGRVGSGSLSVRTLPEEEGRAA